MLQTSQQLTQHPPVKLCCAEHDEWVRVLSGENRFERPKAVTGPERAFGRTMLYHACMPKPSWHESQMGAQHRPHIQAQVCGLVRASCDGACIWQFHRSRMNLSSLHSMAELANPRYLSGTARHGTLAVTHLGKYTATCVAPLGIEIL